MGTETERGGQRDRGRGLVRCRQKHEDMASRIKESFGSCEKTATREMDTISRVDFDNVNKMMLVTLFFFFASPVPVS